MSIRLKRRHHHGKPKAREFSDIPLLSQSSTDSDSTSTLSSSQDDQPLSKQPSPDLSFELHDSTPLEEVLLDDKSTKYVRLKRQLGLVSAISVIINSMIGSGIFVSPKGVLLHAQSIGLSMIIWTICGIFSLLGSLCYAELGTSLPYSGGLYIYIHEIFGGLPAFLAMWVSLIIRIPSGMCIVSMTFASYIIQNLFDGYPLPSMAVHLIAAMILLLLSFLNCYNVKIVMRLQNFFMMTKLLALGLIIVMGIVQLCLGKTENFHNMFHDTTHDPGQVALSIYAGMFAYSGWDGLNCLTEEIKNPSRNLPVAIAIAIPVVTLVYLLTNLAYFTVITPSEMVNTDATAVVYAVKVLGPVAWIMPVFVALSCIGSLNTTVLSCSRMFFVGARVGHLPHGLSMVNVKYLTPIAAILLQCFLGLLMLTTADVYRVITYMEFIESALLGIPIVGLMYLRWKSPELDRPLKVWLFIPILYMMISLFLVIFPWFDSPVETALGVLMCLSGLPAYFVCIKWKKKPKWIDTYSVSAMRFFQKLLYSVPEDRSCCS